MTSLPLPATRDRLLVLSAAILFSTGGAAVKMCSLTAYQIASFRSGLAALFLLALMPSARRVGNPRIWAVGLCYAATMVLYVFANKMTTAANTIFLQGTAPLYILLLGPWLLKERIRRGDVLFMAAIAIGMSLFFVGSQPTASTAPDPIRGNVLAAFVGVFWGLTLMGLRWLGRSTEDSDAPAAVAVGNLLACVSVLPLAFPVGQAGATDWAAVAFLGIFQIAIAYIFLTRGMKRVPALEASLLLLLEPMLNPAWAFFVHGELPTPWAFLGGTIVMAATTLRVLFDPPRPA